MTISKALYSSDKEDWETPQALFDKLDKEFHFNMDVAANEHNAKCPMFFDRNDDGLKMSWAEYAPPDGRRAVVFLNPPYGKAIGQWMAKAVKEAQAGALVVCLVHARTDTSWFQNWVIPWASEVRFIRGRVKFGDGKQSSPFPSCLVIYQPFPVEAIGQNGPAMSSYHQ
jgi:phage N-6-adenine-methyltransferase